MSFQPFMGASIVSSLNTINASMEDERRRTRASRDKVFSTAAPVEQEERWRPRLSAMEVDQPIPEGHLIGDFTNPSGGGKALMRTIHGDDLGRAADEGWTVTKPIMDRLHKGQFRAVPNAARSMLGGPA